MAAKYIPRVCFEFDGVINSYKSGWVGIDKLPDPPVPGIKELIDKLKSLGYQVVICSSRATGTIGLNAIKEYLKKHNINVDYVYGERPPALCYIDSRSVYFNGDVESLMDRIKGFKAWYEG